MLVLDTHVWVWTVEGNARRIGRRTRGLLARAAAREAIRASAASVFEVSALHAAGRLRLGRPLAHWIHDALDQKGVRLAELSPDVALDAGSLPRAALPDPLDRLLVATARQLDATFVTADARVLAYAAETGNVRVHDARR